MIQTIQGQSIVAQIQSLSKDIAHLPEDEAIAVLNAIKLILHEVSPQKEEPVDCVVWVKAETVEANQYNPNVVASPEMKLLELSILSDGYTQPIVVYSQNASHEVVDGFHRYRVGTESKRVRQRVRGYLPVTLIRPDREGYENRVAATIRHNRARGKHQVQAMSEIVQDLTRRNWSKEKIGRELGMDEDEVLRLQQISGLAEMFADREFSQAWEIEGEQNGNEDEG